MTKSYRQDRQSVGAMVVRYSWPVKWNAQKPPAAGESLLPRPTVDAGSLPLMVTG
ncbi:MAG TPA: hypothetical protein VF278_02250 [Pirellulales bacterium]